MLSIANFLFGTQLGRYSIIGAGFGVLLLWWQIDRAWVRSHAKDQGRIEERDKIKKVTERAVQNAHRSASRSGQPAKSSGVRLPGYRY